MPIHQKERDVVVVDPQMIMDRMLHYKERHHAWYVFRSLYWSIYLIVVGLLLVYYVQLGLTLNLFFGTAFLIFAVMLILYGLMEALHHKFMRKYG
ncbi:MAG: hypothetical protein M1569_02235 [Candidatus Marsarchaeota archaeon]|nr:hypothetical protein [Candidatus Marsarchaeota archaeon]MCL5413200.1 hypothetical protein [Candidatus Marsarchaeota archaeon]